MTSDTDAIERAARAIVYLSVEWSGPERLTRRVVQSAIEALPDLGFEFFAVEEDGTITEPWLISRGCHHPRGCGSLMWCEQGRRVHTELLPGKLGAEAIVRKTLALWGN